MQKQMIFFLLSKTYNQEVKVGGGGWKAIQLRNGKRKKNLTNPSISYPIGYILRFLSPFKPFAFYVQLKLLQRTFSRGSYEQNNSESTLITEN